jgi:nondiscriminating aspartyl-tRNA synthetase
LRVLAQDVPKHLNQEIEIAGWVHRIRELGQVNFVILRDRSGFVQLVFHEKPEFSHESVLRVVGRVSSNDKAPGGAEITPSSVTLLSPAAAEIPINIHQDPEKYPLDALLDNRILSLRFPKIRAIFQLQSAILHYLSTYMHSQQFFEIKTSKLISTGTEGGTNLFSVDYFENKVFLAQSPQFYKEVMVSSGLERVFEISHAYRAEKHDTPRHLNEYVSFDVEMAFIQSEADLMDFERGLLNYVFAQIAEHNSSELAAWDATVPGPEAMDKAPVVDHEKAKEIIFKETGKKVFEISPEGERALCDWAQREYGVDAVFLNGWPRKKRPFYTYPSADGLKTMSFDLIFRGLEITSGGRRIHELSMFLDALPKFGLTREGMSDYASIFEFGCPPHGGFAIGVERLTQKILGLTNVKEASPFPRDRKRVRP